MDLVYVTHKDTHIHTIHTSYEIYLKELGKNEPDTKDIKMYSYEMLEAANDSSKFVILNTFFFNA